jgi:predicted CoA-binding protein
MSKIDLLVKDFLAQKRVAVVGVSEKRDTGCNANYFRFKSNGYQVYAINPHLTTFKGDPCYPSLKALPEKPDAVFVLASPRITDQVVQECIELGVKHVWMHCAYGTKPGLAPDMSSVSPNAVELCRRNGIAVIPGSCPNQFLKGDFGHGMMRRVLRVVGNLAVE